MCSPANPPLPAEVAACRGALQRGVISPFDAPASCTLPQPPERSLPAEPAEVAAAAEKALLAWAQTHVRGNLAPIYHNLDPDMNLEALRSESGKWMFVIQNVTALGLHLTRFERDVSSDFARLREDLLSLKGEFQEQSQTINRLMEELRHSRKASVDSSSIDGDMTIVDEQRGGVTNTAATAQQLQ